MTTRDNGRFDLAIKFLAVLLTIFGGIIGYVFHEQQEAEQDIMELHQRMSVVETTVQMHILNDK